MGAVIITAKFSNAGDEEVAKRGFMHIDQVRTFIANNVVVDSGCTGMALPIDIIETLGLEVLKTIQSHTANGKVQRRLYDGLKLEVGDRIGTFRVTELPIGAPPLLGCIPCEELGLQPDLKNHKLIFLPEEGENTHFWQY